MNNEELEVIFRLLITNKKFTEFEKQFAKIVNETIVSNFKKDEPKIVEELTKKLDGLSINKIEIERNYLFNIDIKTEAKFIHGQTFQVEFEHNNEIVNKELGDLIFVNNLFYNNKSLLQKYTITQLKKEIRNRRNHTWNIDLEQLFLLSNFPKFNFKYGNIKNEEYLLRNDSGCEGSYALIYKDDLFFISAPVLNMALDKRRSIKLNDLICYYSQVDKIFPLIALTVLADNIKRPPYINFYLAHNTDDFVHKYLYLGIGETIISCGKVINQEADRLIKDVIKIEEYKRYLKFINDGDKRRFFNEDHIEDGFGFGIINTIINITDRQHE